MYFIYPETCGVRLEDMDVLFGDATNAGNTPASAGTPSMRPDGDYLVHPGSPVPSLDIRGRPQFGTSGALPGLDIEPPTLGSPSSRSQALKEEQGGPAGSWFSRLMGRGRSPSGSSTSYAPLGQRDD